MLRTAGYIRGAFRLSQIICLQFLNLQGKRHRHTAFRSQDSAVPPIKCALFPGCSRPLQSRPRSISLWLDLAPVGRYKRSLLVHCDHSYMVIVISLGLEQSLMQFKRTGSFHDFMKVYMTAANSMGILIEKKKLEGTAKRIVIGNGCRTLDSRRRCNFNRLYGSINGVKL